MNRALSEKLRLQIQNGLFTDGGMALGNPSKIGGSYAWVRVEEVGSHAERPVACDHGSITPAVFAIPAIDNCQMELLALCRGILALPEGWTGTVYCDAKVALGWVFWSWKQDKVHPALRRLVQKTIRRMWKDGDLHGRLKPVWVAGHPRPVHIDAGFRTKDGIHYPVSRWNRWCDEMCQFEVRRLRQSATWDTDHVFDASGVYHYRVEGVCSIHRPALKIP